MIPHAHTVIQPGTVVVKPLHTLPTNRTMPRPRRPNHLTLRAQRLRIDHPYQAHEVHLILDISRLSKNAHQ